MNDGQLRTLLAQHSPWRTEPDWEGDDPDIRAAANLPVAYEPDPLADVRPPGLYVLRGPRRVGKSLELKRTVSRLIRQGVARQNIFFCSCDGLRAQDLRRLVTSAYISTRPLEGPRWWFLDEVTAVPGWSPVIKQLRDQHLFREAGVVLTGSSARDPGAATKDLADRRGGAADSDRLLLPMSFRSFCQAIGGFDDLPEVVVRPKDFLTIAAEQAVYELEPFATQLDATWQLFLDIGGFPRAVAESIRHGDVQRGFIDGLWDVVVGDAIRAANMSDTEVGAFLNRLVAALSSPVNASSVAADVGLRDHERVSDRINDLVTAFVAWRCHRVKNALPNPAAQRKVYFSDPLIARLAHLRNLAFPPPDPSKLSEQQLGLALNRAVMRDRPSAFVESDQVMYERTGTGAEIDFVGQALAVPFESRYEDRRWKRGAQTMLARHGRGVLATRTPFQLHDSGGSPEPVWAVPVAVVAWLLAH